MTTLFGTTHETFRLRVGDVFEQSEGKFIVVRVTASSASCAPLTKQYKDFTPRFKDESIRVPVHQSNTRISSNAEVEILQRLGQKGADEFLNNKTKKERTMKLELGHTLGYSVAADAAEASGTAGRFTVVAVDETCARIASRDKFCIRVARSP